jgi:hypothetical protein
VFISNALSLLFSTDLADTSTHSLRYVLKNRETNEVIFVAVFSLIPKDGSAKKPEPAKKDAPAPAAASTNDDDVD